VLNVVTKNRQFLLCLFDWWCRPCYVNCSAHDTSHYCSMHWHCVFAAEMCKSSNFESAPVRGFWFKTSLCSHIPDIRNLGYAVRLHRSVYTTVRIGSSLTPTVSIGLYDIYLQF